MSSIFRFYQMHQPSDVKLNQAPIYNNTTYQLNQQIYPGPMEQSYIHPKTASISNDVEIQSSSSSESKSELPKKKRVRTSFTRYQLSYLENAFKENMYACSSRRKLISQHLSIHERQVKIWFQNRRVKNKTKNREVQRSKSDQKATHPVEEQNVHKGICICPSLQTIVNHNYSNTPPICFAENSEKILPEVAIPKEVPATETSADLMEILDQISESFPEMFWSESSVGDTYNFYNQVCTLQSELQTERMPPTNNATRTSPINLNWVDPITNSTSIYYNYS